MENQVYFFFLDPTGKFGGLGIPRCQHSYSDQTAVAGYYEYLAIHFPYSDKLAHSLDHIGRFMLAQLALGVGEKVYGLGEQFTEFIKNGQRVRIFNENGGTSSEQAYKTVPFYLTNRGYGGFVDHSELVDFEVGSERSARCQFSVEGQRLKFYIINGPSPKDIFARYTTLTGRPPLPPAWSFGLWLSTSFTTDWTLDQDGTSALSRSCSPHRKSGCIRDFPSPF